MGSVRARRAQGLSAIGLLAGAAIVAMILGAPLAAGIFTVLLAAVAVGLVFTLTSACGTLVRAAAQAETNHREAQAYLADRQKLMDSLLDGFPHPVVLIAVNGQIELSNSAATELGFTRGAPLSSLPEWARQAVAGSPPHEDTMPHDDAIRIPDSQRDRLFLSRAIPLKGGADPGVLVILTDVTDTRRATEARSKLLSSLSHDLKTPMTSIQMSIHLLLEDAGGRLSTRQLEFLEAARDDAQKLHTLIEEMVGAARGRS